jgi:hypothetical protein
LGGPYSRSGSFTAFDPNYATPYVENFTLSVTHQLRRNMTIDVRYAGTQGKKQNGSYNLNLSNVFRNTELFNALETVRAGGEAPIFDQIFAGVNLNNGTTAVVNGTNVPYTAVGTTSVGILQTGSAHLRRRFATDLSEGDYETIANFINSNTGGTPTAGLLNATTAVSNVGGRILRNGCDRLANGFTHVQQFRSTPTGPIQFTPGFNATNATPLRCFPEDYLVTNPQFGNGTTGPTYNSNTGSSNYHSLETQFTLRPTHGTSFTATYTWAKSMETPNDDWTDPLNRDADYRLATNHRSHEFRMNGMLELPLGPNQLLFGNSSGPLARIIENWKFSWTYNIFSGAPNTIEAMDMLYDNGTPDVVGPWDVKKGKVHWGEDVGSTNLGGTFFGPVGSYQVVTDPQCDVGGLLDTTDAMGFNIRRDNGTCPLRAIATPSGQIVLQNPLPGKRGTLGQRSVMGPGSWSLDGSLSKSFRVSESKQVQLRFDATNLLNHPTPFTATGNNTTPEFSINDLDFGTISGKGNQHRSFQGQLRFVF